MTYTVTKLITNAYYIAGVVSREFQTVEGSQFQDGLDMLNDILGDKTVETDMIPYYTIDYNFPAVIGQQGYLIPNLISVETLVFFINGVRYNVSEIMMDQYFGSARAENIHSLPLTFSQQRCFGGAKIYLYFLPDQTYPMQLTGFFRLNNVSINQDLSLTLDSFYISYLKYALACRICTEFNYDLPQGAAKQLLTYQEQISKRSAPMDLTLQIIPGFSVENGGVNYAQANLGKGWTTT